MCIFFAKSAMTGRLSADPADSDIWMPDRAAALMSHWRPDALWTNAAGRSRLPKSEPKDREIIKFDYAIKNILREKANFDILGGLLTELLSRKVKVIDLLESEGNIDDSAEKTNSTSLETRWVEGIVKGRAEGKAEATLGNARNLKKNGIPDEIIAKSLGLPPE
jgi:hypothetical protein